jgi:hypothetical protein
LTSSRAKPDTALAQEDEMPDFTVIDGGGDRGIDGFAGQYAVQCLEDLVIEILRNLARDQLSAGRTTRLMIAFSKAAGEFDGPLFEIIAVALGNLNARTFGSEQTDLDQETQDILRYALRVIAESMATDGAARGRLSQRRNDMRSSIESWVHGREERSRANGWSYLDEMSRKLGKWTPPPRAVNRQPRPKNKKAAPKKPLVSF